MQPGLAQVIGDSDGNRYVHSPRGIHAVNDGAAWTYPLTDALGSVRGYTDAHSNVFSNVNYTPIGVPDENIAGPAFTGEWRSENETQYHRARHLSPGLGGWLALDPFEGVPLNAMSLNRYGYVWGNPVNRADASGLCPQMTIEQTRTAVRTLQAINPSFMSVDGATADVVANIVCAVQTAGQYAPQIVTIGGTSVSVGVTIAGTGAAATAGLVMGVASLGLLLGVGIYLGIWHAPPVPYTPDQLEDMRPPTPTPSPTGTPAPYVQPRPDPALQPQPTPAPTPGDVRIDPRPNDPCRDDEDTSHRIYRVGRDSPKSVSLHKVSDFRTGFSFLSHPPIGSYLTYEVRILRNAGYMVVFDGGNLLMDVWSNTPYIEPNSQETLPLDPDHVSVYFPDYSYWSAWHDADRAVLESTDRTPQMVAFYELRYKG